MEKCKFSPEEIEDLKSQGYSDEQIKGFEGFERIELSLEDWLNPEKPMGGFDFGGWGIQICQTGNKYFSLSKVESERIKQCKQEIVEGFELAYLEALTSVFEERFNASRNQEELIKKELEKVNKLLFQWEERCSYAAFAPGLWLQFQNYGIQKKDSFCYWYERFCIYGEDATKAVSPHHAKQTADQLNNLHGEPLHYIVAVLALDRFKKYLNMKLEEQNSTVPTKAVLSNQEKPEIKAKYCCPYTLEIMQNLVRRYSVTQIEVRHFENFFVQHPYTNLDLGNVYRDKTTEDLDFEKLISRIFEVASLFEKDVQEYFYTCIEEDAERKNKHRFGETDWHILKKKILERRKLERNVSPAMPEAKKGQQDALPLFDDAIKDPDKLPELFKRLAGMDNAFINEHGKIIGGRRARKHREVMALAQLISRWVKVGYGQFEVYSMLCKKVGLDESGRSDKITNRSGYDDIRLILLAELKDLLK